MTGDFTRAALAAGLFAIHPIHTEAVAWISSAADPLLTIFLVLSVYFYADRKGPISFVSLLFATLAMFTKEAGIGRRRSFLPTNGRSPVSRRR
jgi:protein O-mannosyl-transferase